jgi:PhnB protein
MRFLQIINTDMTAPPNPEHQAKMYATIQQAIADGFLVATGGIGKRATASARVTKAGGKVTVQDPPANVDDTWMKGTAFGLGEFPTKEDAIANAKAMLETMPDGHIELIAVSAMYPPPQEAGAPAIPGVVPYINVPNCTEAIEFYKKAFGGREIARMMADDGKRIMHCHLIINGGSLMLADVFEEHGFKHEPSGSFTMTLVISDGQMWWDRALKAGSKETLPFNTAPWGDRYGQQVDPYGVRWAFNQPGKRG